MNKSMFQFSNPHIEEIIFKVNNDNVNLDNVPIEININTNKNENENKAVVTLNLIVGKIDSDGILSNPIYFSGIISANFIWEDDVTDIDEMLKINGGAVLLSYIRPILSSITMQAGIQPMHLPFINFKS